jgi:hypothetical protein
VATRPSKVFEVVLKCTAIYENSGAYPLFKNKLGRLRTSDLPMVQGFLDEILYLNVGSAFLDSFKRRPDK